MKISTALRRAAELLHRNHRRFTGHSWARISCCAAIWRIKNDKNNEVNMFFHSAIAQEKNIRTYWWGNPYFPTEKDTEERIFALLLAAEIAKEDGK